MLLLFLTLLFGLCIPKRAGRVSLPDRKFKEVATDPQQAPHTYLMLAGIAWRHGHLKLAADQLARIRQGTKLLDWEEKIYDEIRSDCGSLLTEAISRVSREQVASSAW